jgi:hypothetical protein
VGCSFVLKKHLFRHLVTELERLDQYRPPHQRQAERFLDLMQVPVHEVGSRDVSAECTIEQLEHHRLFLQDRIFSTSISASANPHPNENRDPQLLENRIPAFTGMTARALTIEQTLAQSCTNYCAWRLFILPVVAIPLTGKDRLFLSPRYKGSASFLHFAVLELQPVLAVAIATERCHHLLDETAHLSCLSV